MPQEELKQAKANHISRIVGAIFLMAILACQSGKDLPILDPVKVIPAGHRNAPPSMKKMVVAMDVSLSMKGYFQAKNSAGGLNSFMDTLRESLAESTQGKESTFEPLCVTGSGLEKWQGRAAPDPVSFFQGLKGRADVFTAGYSDLAFAVRQLTAHLEGNQVFGLFITDLIQSVSQEDSDATGVGLALAQWAKGTDGKPRGLSLIRVDVPFDGIYYPEAPRGAGFQVRGTRRPLYLLVFAPTPGDSCSMRRRLQEIWANKGNAPADLGTVDLTPDLTGDTRWSVEIPSGSRKAWVPITAPEPADPSLWIQRKGKERKLHFSIKPQVGSPMLALALKSPPQIENLLESALKRDTTKKPTMRSKTVSSLVPSLGQKIDNGLGFEYQSELNLSAHKGIRDIVRLSWEVQAKDLTLPGWVAEYSSPSDTTLFVAPGAAGKGKTLNLRPMLETTLRNVGPQRVLAAYICIAGEK